MGLMLTIVVLLVLAGGVFGFAHAVTRRATRGTATQAANLFSRYPEGRPVPEEDNDPLPLERH